MDAIRSLCDRCVVMNTAARSPTARPPTCWPMRMSSRLSRRRRRCLRSPTSPPAYGQHRALDGVALNVGRGEIVAILGANGAGKTTLLKAIAGLVPPLPGGA